MYRQLQEYIEKQGFKGFDPYDVLCSKFPFRLFGRWGEVLAIQFQKRNPINIRPLLGIKKEYNAKAIGLLLESYVTLEKLELQKDFKSQSKFFFSFLKDTISPGFNGACWGYPFAWSTTEKHLPANAPNVVVTAFAVRGLYKYYEKTKDPTAAELIHSAARFVYMDLPRNESSVGTFFSYTPFQQDCCYNASLFAAEILARSSAISKNDSYQTLAVSAVEFVVKQQHDDGHWNYSRNLKTGEERVQIDFHQGYVIDSVFLIAQLLKIENQSWNNAVSAGTKFYREKQFLDSGQSLWRIPKAFPVDIHNQSQGIITFSRMSHLDPSYLPFANTIAAWTKMNMQHASGYFYYRKLKAYTNKISYLRWSNAWMLLALVTLEEKNSFK